MANPLIVNAASRLDELKKEGFHSEITIDREASKATVLSAIQEATRLMPGYIDNGLVFLLPQKLDPSHPKSRKGLVTGLSVGEVSAKELLGRVGSLSYRCR